MLLYHSLKYLLGLFNLVLGLCRIDSRIVQQLPRTVHYGYLAARSVGGVEAHDNHVLYGSHQKEILEILSENLYRLLFRHLSECVSYFPLYRRRNEPLVAVLYRLFDVGFREAFSV